MTLFTMKTKKYTRSYKMKTKLSPKILFVHLLSGAMTLTRNVGLMQSSKNFSKLPV